MTFPFLDAHTRTNYAKPMATTKKEPCSYCLGTGTLTGERAGWAVREVTDTCGFCLGSGYETAACAVCLRGVAVATDADGQPVCSRCLDASMFGVAS